MHILGNLSEIITAGATVIAAGAAAVTAYVAIRAIRVAKGQIDASNRSQKEASALTFIADTLNSQLNTLKKAVGINTNRKSE